MKGNLLIALTGFLPAQTLLAEVKTDTVKFAANIDSIRHANPSVFQATSRHSNLDSLKAEVKRQLESRYGQHYGCASLSLTAICATLGGTAYSERQLRGLSDSFSGGIGHTFSEGTCGALSGAIMALGMYASGDKKLHQKMAAEVFEALKKQEGTVKCGDIYGKYQTYSSFCRLKPLLMH